MKNDKGFQKTFGFTERFDSARSEFIKSEKRLNARYKFGTALTSAMGKIKIAIFILIRLADVSWKSWYVKFFCLHKCNFRLLAPNHKAEAILQLIKEENELKEYNWYYHVILLKKIKEYIIALRYQTGDASNKVENIIQALSALFSLYTDHPEELKSSLFSTSLADTVYDLALTIQKLKIRKPDPLVPIYEFLITHLKDTKLLNIYISLQIIIEVDHNQLVLSKFSTETWDKITADVYDENQDISQACKDILTYLVIGSKHIPHKYKLTSTLQDKFLAFYLNKK